MRLLVTGGAGFIGGNFLRWLLKTHPDWHIINLDLLSYAGSVRSLDTLQGPNYTFIKGDIADTALVDRLFQTSLDAVINFAAESHVDRSITGPSIFVQTNILGTQVLLEAARRYGVGRFLQVSTDEVYGSLGETGLFTEQSPLDPSSPYSASKASADLLVQAYYRTYKLPVLITRCSNNYGPYQHPEKLIPRLIVRALQDQPLPIFGDGLNVRDWIHVMDHVQGLMAVLEKGSPGQVYNLGGNQERPNLWIAQEVLRILGKPTSLIQFVTDRLGHDRRYAIDASYARETLSWSQQYNVQEGLEQTVAWYCAHQEWWEPLSEKPSPDTAR